MFDVLVIGAGLSGLQAAYTAQQSGLSTVVIEARNRVGGKIWSVPLASGRGYAELGGAWINDTLQPRVWAYTQQFGLKVVKQRLEGRAVMQESEDVRYEFPFGVTPRGVSHSNLFIMSMTYELTCLYSSPPKKRRIWSIFGTISKRNR